MINLLNAGAVLTIDLSMVAKNWRKLKAIGGNNCDCAAAVKTDAYGLGAQRIASTLAWAGCKHFFVAHVFEGVALRSILGEQKIYVLHGPVKGSEKEFFKNDLIPVLSTPEHFELWQKAAKNKKQKLPAVIHVDTGMVRLGLSSYQFSNILNDFNKYNGIEPVMLMSHLACADEPEHTKNGWQLNLFKKNIFEFKKLFSNVPISFSNSAGIFLGKDYHFDILRPGIALYGGSPRGTIEKNPMEAVISLKAKVLQVHEIDSLETVGYGATWITPNKRKIATVGVGYGDGFPRALSNKTSGYIGDKEVFEVGRISMDLMTFDVTDVSEKDVFEGSFIEIIGSRNPIDDVASKANTVSYEILTNLGRRYYRKYIGEAG